ncbi:MAG: alanine racemase, partial [bacterium]
LGAYVSSLSQEHGILHIPRKVIRTIQPGDLLAILPAHSCITVSSLKKYLTLAGETILAMP